MAQINAYVVTFCWFLQAATLKRDRIATFTIEIGHWAGFGRHRATRKLSGLLCVPVHVECWLLWASAAPETESGSEQWGRRKGGRAGVPRNRCGDMALRSHMYQSVSSGLCALRTKRLCRSSVCQLGAKEQHGGGSGGRGGWSAGRGAVCVLASVTPVSRAWM